MKLDMTTRNFGRATAEEALLSTPFAYAAPNPLEVARRDDDDDDGWDEDDDDEDDWGDDDE